MADFKWQAFSKAQAFVEALSKLRPQERIVHPMQNVVNDYNALLALAKEAAKDITAWPPPATDD